MTTLEEKVQYFLDEIECFEGWCRRWKKAEASLKGGKDHA